LQEKLFSHYSLVTFSKKIKIFNYLSDLISVIIPVYNTGDFIFETLNSVMNQTYKKIEIIIIDDFSTDNTMQIVKNFIKTKKKINIKLLSLNKNSGFPAVPRNKGIKLANGRYIAFLDSDDIWHPQKLELQMRALKNSNSYMCSSYAQDFYKNEYKKKIKKNIKNNFYKSISLFQQMIKYRTSTSSILVCSKIAKKNLFDQDSFYKGKEDLKFSLLIHSKYGNSIKCKNILVFYRNHPYQISKNKLLMFLKTMMILMFTKLNKNNFIRLLFPVYLITNIFFYIYLRKILKII
jgi:teichuronic acid biosynthesis glycosyltransferase TuaG